MTASERARLRPGVDAAALDRLLAALDAAGYGTMRRHVVGQFYDRPTFEDARAALRDVGAHERLADVERWYPVVVADMRARLLRKRVGMILFAWHGRLTDPAEQLAAELLRVDLPPGAPDEVRALWDAVEPDGEAAFRRALASVPSGPGVIALTHTPGPRPRRWCDACEAREATIARVIGAAPAALIPMTDAAAVYDEDDIPLEVRRALYDAQTDTGAATAEDATDAPIVQYFCEDCARRRAREDS